MSAKRYIVQRGVLDGFDVVRVNAAGQGWHLTTYRSKGVADFVAAMLAQADRLDEGTSGE